MASSILLSNCQIVEIQRQTNSMSPIQTSTPINQTKLKRCTCCPYGYHIDLDFIRYCEELANNGEKPTNEQLERRNKRRQRKSLEVMLGFNEDWYSDYERSVHSAKQQELSFQTIYEVIMNIHFLLAFVFPCFFFLHFSLFRLSLFVCRF